MNQRAALVADDCPLTRAVHADLLRLLGYRTTIVASGNAAADEVRRALDVDGLVYDLILLDYDMPDGDGPQAVRIIRTIGRQRYAAPIYCVSGHASDRIDAACRAAGFDRVLRKPLGQNPDLHALLLPARDCDLPKAH